MSFENPNYTSPVGSFLLPDGPESSKEVVEFDYFRTAGEVEAQARGYDFDKTHVSTSDAYAISEEFGYYMDGMLGPFEHMKWPQGLDAMEPHLMATPINPFFYKFSDALTDPPEDLRRHSRSEAIALRAEVPRRPVPELDVWADADAPWFSFTPQEWTMDPFTTKDLGHVSRDVVSRLRAASRDTETVLSPHIETLVAGNHNNQPRMYVSGQALALGRAISRLDVDLPLVEGIRWFREAQRILLNLRSWYNYMVVLKPRIEAYSVGNVQTPFPLLPVRGVFVGRRATVEMLLKVGIPVWWVRPMYSLNPRCQIGFCAESVPWTAALSSHKVQMICPTNVVAPPWIDAAFVETSTLGLTERLRQYSLLSRPVLRVSLPVATDALDNSEPEEGSPNGALASAVSNHPFTAIESKPHASTSTAASLPPPKKRAKTSHKAKKSKPSQPREVPKRPEWLPPTHPTWASVEESLANIAHPVVPQPILYGLPPFSSFSGLSSTPMRMHHWLRIRPHYYATLIQQGDAGIPILLTSKSWRFALEGRYYRYDMPEDTEVKPHAPPEKIAQLPEYQPTNVTVLGKRSAPDSDDAAEPGGGKRFDRRRFHFLAERIDIAVHFHVDYGVPLYQRDLQPWPQWRGQPVDPVRAETDRVMWAEIGWELSVLHFRLELIWCDAEVMERRLAGGAKRRLDKWFELWPELTPGTDPASFDYLLSPLWTDRRTGVSRLSNLLCDWPHFSLQRYKFADGISEAAFISYEKRLYEKYCHSFHARKGRLPTLPLTRPPSIPQGEKRE
ncbi:hypothetical protein FA95DRAFT_1566773 [Auriscalpium vulgare]|uniref:Uncharacterized protein n=1 Tax=Auriscalpium vulgare TaxID=40419 RepID=A0ACB8R7N6_9AGAM|nr:hypothetical protein FA95DRAFT_1566773 [Auriscalpium vulgare]